MSNLEKWVAYHRAGHAAASALIEQNYERDGGCSHEGHAIRWNAEYEAMAALAGPIAERMFIGQIEQSGAANDIANAFRHIKTMTPVPSEQAAYVSFLNTRIELLLERHRDFIVHIATQLECADSSANDFSAALKIARSEVAGFAKPALSVSTM